MRFLSEWNRPKDFFLNGWNCFDSALVVGSFLPLGNFPLIKVIKIGSYCQTSRERTSS